MKVLRSVFAVALVAALSTASFAASHREAPLIALDPTADITDVYAFRSWEDPSKVVFILNVIPGQEPGSGPNYFNFDDQVTYDINLDIDQDGKADDILGATFDTLNFRSTPILSDSQDANDNENPFGNDTFSGFNVSTIAIEVPITDITDNPHAVIGMYGSTSRPRVKRLQKDGTSETSGKLIQVARMGNPLVNELLIGLGQKDLWNATDPEDEKQFLDFYLNPRLAGVINLAFGTAFPTTGRTDLVQALLKYPGQNPNVCKKSDRCAELLRLDLAATPTPPESQRRLGGLGGDAAGYPNGRRPKDDVTDIVLRVVAGAWLGPVPNLGDGVNFNIGAQGANLTANGIYTVFPFLPTPHDGRNRQHIDCDEAGANPCN